MTTDRIPSLVAFEDVPRWASNSLHQYTSQESTPLRLACHAAAPDTAGQGIRVPDAETKPSVRIEFLHAVAVQMRMWDGDTPSGHARVAAGLQRNGLFEVVDSRWLPVPARESAWKRMGSLRHVVCAFRIHAYEIAAEGVRWQELDDPPPLALSRTKFPLPDWR